MTIARKDIIAKGEVASYHVLSRCVRRAFLCGEDTYTGKNYDHRKAWIMERLKFLLEFFSVELITPSIMSNHMHLELRTRPDLAKRLTPAEVEENRERLGDPSWFMRCLNEWIARKANQEDGCTGRFWEGRFKCKRLYDDAAVLACMAYIDLNPVRAQVAQTPEESLYTGARERIVARQAKAKVRAPASAGSRACAPVSGPSRQNQAELNRKHFPHS